VNAERLHAIVNSLQAETSATKYPEYLEQLVEGLQEAVEAPKQPGPQEKVSTARKNLATALREAPSNEFSPAWRQALEEMGVADLLGTTLADELDRIFTQNEITPKTARDELTEIQSRVQALGSALEKASLSLEFFRIGSEELSPGEFEIGFLIPRVQVDNGLEHLGSEFTKLRRIIGPFSELAGESRPDVPVRSISSSEFQVFLDSAPVTAVLFTHALGRVLGIYQQILDIRLKHRELSEDDNVPEEALQPLVDYANEQMRHEIPKIVEEVLAKARLDDDGRLNELRNDLTRQISALADRVDRGFDVEVRAGEIPDSTEDEGEEGEVDTGTREAARTVLNAQKSIEFMNVTGKPILGLEQRDEDAAD
jgi:hypothetical protein